MAIFYTHRYAERGEWGNMHTYGCGGSAGLAIGYIIVTATRSH
jgi:hypothetical protein